VPAIADIVLGVVAAEHGVALDQGPLAGSEVVVDDRARGHQRGVEETQHRAVELPGLLGPHGVHRLLLLDIVPGFGLEIEDAEGAQAVAAQV
jgi:hypothetical protein